MPESVIQCIRELEWKTNKLRLVRRVFLVTLLPCLVPVMGSDLNLPIGFLSSPQDDLPLQTEQEIYHALEMAVEDLNARRHQLLPNVSFSMLFKKIGTNQSIAAALDEVMRSGAVTVFGHASICSYIPSALKSRNRIAISNVCGDEKLSDKELFPTFLRTRPPDTQMVDSMLALLQHYSLKSVSLIVQNTSKWLAMAESLERRRVEGHMNDVTILHRTYFNDSRLCCALRYPCCYVAWPFEIFKKIKSLTNVYIFLGEKSSLRLFTQAIEDSELWRANEYLVISCDSEAFSTSWAVDFIKHPREIQKEMAKSKWDPRSAVASSREFDAYSNSIENEWMENLPTSNQPSLATNSRMKTTPRTIMVIRNIANEQLNYFTRRLRAFSSNKLSTKQVGSLPSSVYAAYAYDAIVVLVEALAFHVKKFSLFGKKHLKEAALNGTSLFNAIMEIKNFSSVRGGFISFDTNGDSEDSYIAVGSKDLFVHKNKTALDNTLTQVNLIGLVPFGYFRGIAFHPTLELNQTVHFRLAQNVSENDHAAEYTSDGELLTCNINVMVIVAHLLALAGMGYTFTHQAKKVAGKMETIAIRVEMSTEEDLSTHLLNTKQMRVMNYSWSKNKDDWRMKVWNKTLIFKTSSWPTLICETIQEIRQIQRLHHENVNPVLCAIIEPARICLISEFQTRRSLLDALAKPNLELDCKMVASFALDLVRGMLYLQSTNLHHLAFHGNLKSSNCLVDSNWTVKLTGFGFHRARNASKVPYKTERDYYFDLLWKAPEVLRNPSVNGSPEGDVYSFAIILHELVVRQGPFSIFHDLGDPIRVVNQVKHAVRGRRIPMRPTIETVDCRLAYMVPCMVDCWTEEPSERPNFSTVYNYLTKLGGSHAQNKVSSWDTDSIDEKKRALEEEIRRIDDILHRIIPKSVANCLANGLPVESELWENVTVFEADLVGFTEIAAETTPLGTMILLDDVYTLFDSIARGYDVCKVGTIGDAYIVVSGTHSTKGINCAGEIASMALEVVEKMKTSGIEHRGKPLVVRIGVHTGDLVTGVVGSSTLMPTYSIFGDTVSTASRLESTSSELRIQISEASYQALQKIGGYITEERNDKKNAQEPFKTYWLIGHTEKAVQRREKNSSGTQSLCDRQSIISLSKTDIIIDSSIDDDPQI